MVVLWLFPLFHNFVALRVASGDFFFFKIVLLKRLLKTIIFDIKLGLKKRSKKCFLSGLVDFLIHFVITIISSDMTEFFDHNDRLSIGFF